MPRRRCCIIIQYTSDKFMAVSDTIMTFWLTGRKTKHTPSGWVSSNSVCCEHNGHKPDTRKRGGMIINNQGGITYSCFNCGFKASWNPGRTLGKNIKNLLRWMNVPSQEIRRLAMHALRTVPENPEDSEPIVPEFETKELPKNAQPLQYWIDRNDTDIYPVLEYLEKRSISVDSYDYHWTNDPSWRDRLIIPYTNYGRLVGWTARSIVPAEYRYISDKQPGYIFGLDRQGYQKKFGLLMEGVFDAILLDGMALMSTKINQQQVAQLQLLCRPIIVVPDRDTSGRRLVDIAITNKWHVSFPNWEPDMKDANDAVTKYGRLYTLYDIVNNVETTELKIKLNAKRWFKPV